MKRIAIIGGGVGGLTAAVYALRANAEVVLFEQFGLGGLVATIDKIENFPSYTSIEGWQLADSIAKQAKKLGLAPLRQRVVSLTLADDGQFVVQTDRDKYLFPAVVVATGTSHNKLGIEADWVGKGVSYCATCDGGFFKGKRVAVIGSGNQAVGEALYLSELAAEVYLLAGTSGLNAEQINIDRLTGKQNVTVWTDTSVARILGENVVGGITVVSGGTEESLPVEGVFVATGATPVTDFVRIDGVKNSKGYLVVDNRCETAVKGLFAAGDVTDGALKQIVTACGDGAKAGSLVCVRAAEFFAKK